MKQPKMVIEHGYKQVRHKKTDGRRRLLDTLDISASI